MWDEGAPGKEPMVRILGRTPAELVDKALRYQSALVALKRDTTAGKR